MASFARANEIGTPPAPAESRVAYVRMLRSEDVGFVYREAPLLAPGQTIFALVLEDGTPLSLSDSRELALADAQNYQLETVSLN